MAAVAAAEELPAAEAAAARRQGGRTRRRRRVVEAGRGVPLHLGHHTVSEGGSRGRESPEVPHPVGIIGRMSAGGHDDPPQVQRGDQAGFWPDRAAQPTVPVSRTQTDSEETAPGVEQGIQYLLADGHG